ncbi:MAG: hypothetical protein KGH61_04510 [Candidatus Micrarchaeota archaeon]|nr:hypothetical protein [Candidatus Micrarchaeota archaeon]MDE1848179.1 hypothetical protein [Candidatus Micrarchaeota archaeon]MDE1864660.1 hypothetical protein [Candidatus Micrarchaeota archaeon]
MVGKRKKKTMSDDFKPGSLFYYMPLLRDKKALRDALSPEFKGSPMYDYANEMLNSVIGTYVSINLYYPALEFAIEYSGRDKVQKLALTGVEFYMNSGQNGLAAETGNLAVDYFVKKKEYYGAVDIALKFDRELAEKVANIAIIKYQRRGLASHANAIKRLMNEREVD